MAHITPTGFREYDVRWRYPEEIDLAGMEALGLGLGTQMRRRGIAPEIAVGHDFRSYAPAVKDALVAGLVRAGIRVSDIGLALSPMMYFSYFHLGTPAMAMVTASHNPNGWTGVKMGFEAPLTHGQEEMAELRQIVLGGEAEEHPGGSVAPMDGLKEAYLDDLAGDFRLSRPLRVVCATGNGTAGAFAPELLARLGAEVVPRHTELDHSFPHYNPNPEGHEMLDDMAAAVAETGADFALGFDGDGDRCGVVDGEGVEISSDKMGVIFARDLAKEHEKPLFIADVKSTGLFVSDPELQRLGGRVEYWKTGHSYLKRHVRDKGALAGFERSGHYYFAPPVGRGYDCGPRVAVELLKLLDRNPDKSLTDLRRALPRTWITPTLAPYCADTEKYGVMERLTERIEAFARDGGTLGGQRVVDVVTVNGARLQLANGGWGLVRASSNTPNLVVVCESPVSGAEMRAIFADLDRLVREEPLVGAYDQEF